MKKKLFIIFVLFISLFMISGCSQKNEKSSENNTSKEESVEPNNTVGYLKFYVPDDFQYDPDLRGLAYAENEKKVFIKGDYYSDPYNVVSLVVYVNNAGMGAKAYADSINENLTDEDVKYSLKSNNKITEIYAREDYVIGDEVNYAYIMDYGGYIHIVNIRGPKDKKDEMVVLLKKLFPSLVFNS